VCFVLTHSREYPSLAMSADYKCITPNQRDFYFRTILTVGYRTSDQMHVYGSLFNVTDREEPLSSTLRKQPYRHAFASFPLKINSQLFQWLGGRNDHLFVFLLCFVSPTAKGLISISTESLLSSNGCWNAAPIAAWDTISEAVPFSSEPKLLTELAEVN
jgi:hypothetical protein